eukprot:731510-Amphidinium_carterae.2
MARQGRSLGGIPRSFMTMGPSSATRSFKYFSRPWSYVTGQSHSWWCQSQTSWTLEMRDVRSTSLWPWKEGLLGPPRLHGTFLSHKEKIRTTLAARAAWACEAERTLTTVATVPADDDEDAAADQKHRLILIEQGFFGCVRCGRYSTQNQRSTLIRSTCRGVGYKPQQRTHAEIWAAFAAREGYRPDLPAPWE